MVAPRSTNGRPFAVSPFSAASSPRSHRRGRSSCGGFTLVFVAVMLFVFFCLGALVIDMGFVRLTQGQMLSNVNTAAREGLRWRDVQLWENLPTSWTSDPNFLQAVGASSPLADPITPAQQDAIRRWAAANVATLLYNQVANSTASDPAQYGVGPEVQFTASSGGSSLIGPTIAPGDPPVYVPQLQLNSGNAINGDMVAGTYGTNASFPAQQTTSPTAQETDDYQRSDFSLPSSTSPLASQSATGFLVRMRRVAPGNPADQEVGVSSAGDAVPYIFGRGTPMDSGQMPNAV